MTYENALKYIDSTYYVGAAPSLSRIRKLLEILGNPEKSLKFIHVAGTNGKGSTANAIASVLSDAGYKTGLYTSPFITDFRERIKLNGEMIPKTELAELVCKVIPAVEKAKEAGVKPNEFEVVTALAFLYYKKQNCDVVVSEVGLGGRYDATNVIDSSLVSVITSISFDHTKLLGNTLTEIASEKAGIIKRGGTVVVSPKQDPEALEEIMKNCAEMNATIIIPNDSSVKIEKESIDGTDVVYGKLAFHIPLCGRHQIRNFLTALESLNILKTKGFAITDENIKNGFKKVRFEARLEKLNETPLVLLDGAHNPNGTEVLGDAICRYLKNPPVVIMGMLKDKDYETSLKNIARIAKTFIAIKPNSPRALSEKETAKTASLYCKNTKSFENYKEAFEFAINICENSPIVICGSLYLAGEMRKIVLDYFKK